MGAGIAAEIKRKYPDAYRADLATAFGSRHKLGLFSVGVVANNPNVKHIVNLYGQYSFGTGRVELDYEAFSSGIQKVVTWAEGIDPNMTVGIPYGIGCGLAGGDWRRVKEIINQSFANTTVKGVVCRKV